MRTHAMVGKIKQKAHTKLQARRARAEEHVGTPFHLEGTRLPLSGPTLVDVDRLEVLHFLRRLEPLLQVILAAGLRDLLGDLAAAVLPSEEAAAQPAEALRGERLVAGAQEPSAKGAAAGEWRRHLRAHLGCEGERVR